jgi:cytochrome c oxidase cbb3-type subunit IV
MEFDINTLRAIATVASFAAFLGIVWWAWSKRRSSDFAEAANLPFQQD